MKYCVIVSRTGSAFIEANSASEAMELANRLKTDEINWSDDWEATDVSEDESIIDAITFED